MLREPISFTGRLDLQDLLDIHSTHLKAQASRTLRWIAVIASSLSIVSMIVAGWILGFALPMIVVLAVCIWLPFGWWLSSRFIIRRHYKKHSGSFIESTVIFTNETVTLSNARSDVRLDWKLLGSVVNVPLGLLFLLPGNSTWFWLPKSLFEGNRFREEILDLAAGNAVRIRHDP